MDDAGKIKFLDLLRSTKREGIEDLICWIESTDFFSAPASTRYHDSFEGGLLQHSLRVHDWLKALVEFYSNSPLATGSLKELTPDSVGRIHHTFAHISGVDYNNLHTKSNVMLDVESYIEFGLISENNFLHKLIGNGYLKDKNGDECYGDIYEAFRSIAGFKNEYGYYMREYDLLDIIENYSAELPDDNVLGHINFWANQYIVDMVTGEINEKLREYKYEEKDDIFHIYDSGDSYISVNFNMDNAEFFKDVVAKHPEFFDDMSNNVKTLLSRIDNESDFKETFENNSKSSKNKQKH